MCGIRSTALGDLDHAKEIGDKPYRSPMQKAVQDAELAAEAVRGARHTAEAASACADGLREAKEALQEITDATGDAHKALLVVAKHRIGMRSMVEEAAVKAKEVQKLLSQARARVEHVLALLKKVKEGRDKALAIMTKEVQEALAGGISNVAGLKSILDLSAQVAVDVASHMTRCLAGYANMCESTAKSSQRSQKRSGGSGVALPLVQAALSEYKLCSEYSQAAKALIEKLEVPGAAANKLKQCKQEARTIADNVESAKRACNNALASLAAAQPAGGAAGSGNKPAPAARAKGR